MSEKIQKEEVKNLDVKSFLKGSVGKLAILAAAAASLSSCHHTNWGVYLGSGGRVPYSSGGCHGGGSYHGGCGGTHTHYCSNGLIYHRQCR